MPSLCATSISSIVFVWYFRIEITFILEDLKIHQFLRDTKGMLVGTCILLCLLSFMSTTFPKCGIFVGFCDHLKA